MKQTMIALITMFTVVLATGKTPVKWNLKAAD